MLGTFLCERYRILAVLGEGGMGAIYEAEDVTAQRTVAIKVIARELTDRDVFVKRFHREAEAATAIDSPHVTAVFDTGVDPTGAPFIVMERLAGDDLGGHLRRTAELPVDVALRIAAQTCAGLQKAHEAGIVHRDIKPSNLFLAEDASRGITVKLLDFGIAKLRADLTSDLRASSLTQTGAVLGSPLYMSPEQSRGSGDVDKRADVWSLGVVLYQMLTGRTPKKLVDGVGSLIVSICTERAPPVQDAAPWVPRPVAQIVQTALELRREARFQTAAEMLAAIEACLPHGSVLRKDMLLPLASEERGVIADRTPVADDTNVDAKEPPSGAPRQAPSVRRATKPSPEPDGPRVLIVEDNDMNMDMLSRRLARKNYRVLKATDGETGVALAIAERPDLVLMDVGLPGIDGWSAVREIRANAGTSSTPIIALTALATEGDRERSIEVGCDDYETKPVDLTRLLNKIEALLKR